jgi:hypothetical protein
MKETRLGNLFTIPLLIVILHCPSYSQEDFKYKDRGNRKEGIKPFDVSGCDLELLSFLSYLEPAREDTTVGLKVRFFVPQDTNVFISAKELMPQKSYLMHPDTTYWREGWCEFSPWPTGEVLKPLGIAPNQLGIVARLRKDWVGSGGVIPLCIYHTRPIAKVEKYTLHLRSKENLSKVQYTLRRLGSKEPVIGRITLRSKFYGAVAFPITFDLDDQRPGYFKLIVKCEFEGKIGGPKRNFVFYHNPIVEE